MKGGVGFGEPLFYFYFILFCLFVVKDIWFGVIVQKFVRNFLLAIWVGGGCVLEF